MDFGDTRRGEVVEYVRRKYGDDHVAQIVTFGTMAARGVIRDVGRALNMSYADCDVIAKLIPAGPHVTLDDALRISRELREKYEGDEQVKKLIDGAPARACPRPPRRRRRGYHEAPRRRLCPARAQRRHDRLPVRDDDARRARLAQNGLPWSAQPHDSG